MSEELRERVERIVIAHLFTVYRGCDDDITTQEIERESSDLTDRILLALLPTEGEPVGYVEEDEIGVNRALLHQYPNASRVPVYATPQESAEVERLNRLCDEIATTAKNRLAEVERLRDQLKVERERVADLEGSLAEWKADLLALEPEVERLRSALEKIAKGKHSAQCNISGVWSKPPTGCDSDCPVRIARTALNTETDDEKS